MLASELMGQRHRRVSLVVCWGWGLLFTGTCEMERRWVSVEEAKWSGNVYVMPLHLVPLSEKWCCALRERLGLSEGLRRIPKGMGELLRTKKSS